MLPGIRLAPQLLTAVAEHLREIGETPIWEVDMNLKALELLFGAGYASVQDFDDELDFVLLAVPKMTPALLEGAREAVAVHKRGANGDR
jgi:hypothetical protein